MWEPKLIVNPVWEPVSPRAVCKDCGKPVNTKNVLPPERCMSCAATHRERERGNGVTRYCEGCERALAPSSRPRTTRCRSCSAKARMRGPLAPRPPRVMDPIKGTAMPQYTTSPRAPGKPTLFEMIGCGMTSNNGYDLYNVYVGHDLAGRLERCEGGWRIQGGDGSVYTTPDEFSKCLTDALGVARMT